MFRFGTKSKQRLGTCHTKLQRVFNEVIKYIDCSVLEGHRDAITQNKYYEKGKSKVKYPDGRHNQVPSMAVDVVPYPVDWEDLERMTLFAGFVLGIAKSMDIDIIWGNDWDGDFQTKDTGFHDYPHFELKKEK